MNHGLKESEGQRSNINVKFKRFSPRHKENCPILLWNILCWNNGDNNTLLAFDGGINFPKIPSDYWLVMFFFFFQEIAGSYLTPEPSQNMEATCFAIPATERISGPKVMVSEDYTWTMEGITQWVSIFHFAHFQLFSSVLNVIGGDFTIQSNHYYY